MRPGNPALDALRRNVSGKVAAGEAVPVVAVEAPRRCGCPDDCGCRYPWRVNYCGCRSHA